MWIPSSRALDTSSNNTALAKMQQGLQELKNKFLLNSKRATRLHVAFQVRMTFTGMLENDSLIVHIRGSRKW